MYLLDINVWLALFFDQHAHHSTARAWLNGLAIGQRCFFCRHTQLGFLRLATNPRSNPLQTQTLAQAWALYDGALLDPRVGMVNEPSSLEPAWRRWTQLGGFSPNVWGDAYLAAFADAGNYELVTFDQGFAKFAGLRHRLLP